MTYEEVFNVVLRRGHDQLGCRQDRGRRGDLVRADAMADAVCNAFHYQRSHVDAFTSAMALCESAAVPDEVVEVVDIGCGAGSGAIGLVELWSGESAPAVVDYTGVDHNRHARQLASRMIEPLRPEWLTWTVSNRLPPPRDDIDRAVFVLSYVLQQSEVDQDQVHAWAQAIVDRLEFTDAVEVVVTQVNQELRTRNWYPVLAERLCELAPMTTLSSRSLRVVNRLPGTDTDWVVRAPGRTAEWRNVAVHVCTVAG